MGGFLQAVVAGCKGKWRRQFLRIVASKSSSPIRNPVRIKVKGP